MATRVYKTKTIKLIDGTEIDLVPLKIKYLRQVMDIFDNSDKSEDDDDTIFLLLKCAHVAMKQYYPAISNSIEAVEDNLVLQDLYDILDFGAGIKFNKTESEEKEDKVVGTSEPVERPTWESLDLAKLEAEVFLIGIWKDYDELEKSLSMPELLLTLESKRELDYTEKKFLAAIQGVDIDGEEEAGQKQWEDMKARVFSGGATSDSNDILALQGINAEKMGFGIGFGLDYNDDRDPSLML